MGDAEFLGHTRRLLRLVDFWNIMVALSVGTVVLLSVGLAMSGFSRAWGILVWLVLSMSMYWVLDRVLHSSKPAAGETERDGMIWLVPLAFALVPASVFLMTGSVEERAGTLVLWSFAAAFLVQFRRPEVAESPPGECKDHDCPNSKPCPEQRDLEGRILCGWKPRYLERQGFVAGLSSLFRTKLQIDRPPWAGSAHGKQRGRMSASTALYYVIFGVVAGGLVAVDGPVRDLDVSNLEGERLVAWASLLAAYAAGVLAFGGAFAALLNATYSMPASPTGWVIQDDERQVLAILYGTATLNVIAISGWVFALPLFNKIAEATL